MRKKLQIWIGLIFFLFLLPIVADKIPAEAKEEVPVVAKKDQRLVYASNLRQIEPPPVVEEVAQPKTALVYFTHYSEAFKPITKAFDGKVTASHSEKNIMNFGEQLKAHLGTHQITTDVLDVKVPHNSAAYNAVRPYVKQKIEEKSYDIILDIHRDALTRERTTITQDEISYAKIAIVIGQENRNYRWNEALAERVSKRMNEIVPDISRGLLPKKGHGVDGNYNQDLSKNLLLIEIGGVDNTEEEINRTISVLSKAVADVLNAEELAKD